MTILNDLTLDQMKEGITSQSFLNFQSLFFLIQTPVSPEVKILFSNEFKQLHLQFNNHTTEQDFNIHFNVIYLFLSYHHINHTFDVTKDNLTTTVIFYLNQKLPEDEVKERIGITPINPFLVEVFYNVLNPKYSKLPAKMFEMGFETLELPQLPTLKRKGLTKNPNICLIHYYILGRLLAYDNKSQKQVLTTNIEGISFLKFRGIWSEGQLKNWDMWENRCREWLETMGESA